MRRILTALLPPLVLGLVLSLIFLLPQNRELQPSAISPDLPLGYALSGWYGIKQQESVQERTMLAGDTVFSKAVYRPDTFGLFDMPGNPPPVSVSIVYSGSDMNASIHRPERCLPSQGHVDLHSDTADVKLDDGHVITFVRLSSRVPLPDTPEVSVQHINYYVFIGCDSIRTTHWDRTLRDMLDRSMRGIAQRWAYYQIGAFWGGGTGYTEEDAEAAVRSLIGRITPKLVDWGKIEK